MVFLHPVYTFIFLFLAIASYIEIYLLEKKTPVFIIIAWLMLVFVTGFRYFVGADYPVYRDLFTGFPLYTTYQDVLDKALFRPSSEQIEWIYVLLNKLIFDVGLPFYYVTFIMVMVSVALKFSTFYKNLAYPILGAFMYFMPLHFFEDSGQMRQGMAVAISVFSFKYIKSRNVWMYLLLMYLSFGFHKTTIVFLPAYWIVKIPLNSQRILMVIVLGVLMSPFEVYNVFGNFLDSLGSQDISNGFTGYVDDSHYGRSVDFGLGDIVKIIFVFLLIKYDKICCEKIEYYEYMRNLAVFGLFIYYIFRENRIFAIRLPGAYLFFMSAFVIPSIVFALKDSVRRIMHNGVMLYLFLMYFNFSRGNGIAGNFTIDKYRNIFWRK